MFINAVSYSANLYAQKQSQKTNAFKNLKNHSASEQIAFRKAPATNPEIMRNQFKILLTMDIFAPKLKVKMPETPLEKEVLLEVLQYRQKLEKYTRLNNERFRLKNLIGYINSLRKDNPSHPDLPILQEKLNKNGNIETVMNNLDKQIDLETKKNKHALEYFDNIAKLEDEYLANRLIKVAAMDKFAHKINKNNLNPDEKYSTKDLIKIITEGVAPAENKPAAQTKPSIKETPQTLTKKEFLMYAQEQYEDLLRTNINLYEGKTNHNQDARNARKIITETNASLIKKFAASTKLLLKLFENAEKKYTFKVDRLANIDIYPIGEIWDDMAKVETSIKNEMQEISALKNKLAKSPHDGKLRSDLKSKEETLEELKTDWIKGLKYSLKYENVNRERMKAAGRLAEYDYLTAKNKVLNKYKTAYDIYKNNNNRIPDENWDTILN